MKYLLFFCIAAPLAAQTTLIRIDVKGLTALPAAPLIAATGLKEGQPGSKASYDQACNRLLKTGLIEACQYSFSNAPAGQSVEFTLREAERTLGVSISVPGVSDDELWQWLAKNEPLLGKQIPDNDDATQFYISAVERFAKARNIAGGITADVQTDLGKKLTSLRFRPSHLDTVNGVIFSGVTSIDAAVLKAAVEKVTKGSGYLESSFRELLMLNATPLFERAGLLAIAYPKITRNAEGIVSVEVMEGPVYRFGKTSPGLPAGAIANWSQVQALAYKMEADEHEQGYLNAQAKVNRKLQPGGTADVEIAMNRGPQFRFGEVRITGLDASVTARLMKLWKLQQGEPMRASYPGVFLKEASDAGLLGTRSLDASIQTEPRIGSPNTVDVVIAFKK